eukprot:Seg559.1 transcript_id=Seg559.1/GoldUCD/mRNA.D3Y31 product="E3 ubiquitin-protein ligase RNF4" protein_id=Seg559.1/GoldUCD/D3Y31
MRKVTKEIQDQQSGTRMSYGDAEDPSSLLSTDESRTSDTANSSIDNSTTANVIDIEALRPTQVREQKEVVDLTKGYGSSVVDLTGDDSPIQTPGRQRGHRANRMLYRSRNTSPYHRSDPTPSSDVPEVIPIPSTPETSTSVEATPVTESPAPKKISCPICMDDVDRITRGHRQLVSTTCGHLFCNRCIVEAVRLQHKCPTCRKKLNNKQFHPVYI